MEKLTDEQKRLMYYLTMFEREFCFAYIENGFKNLKQSYATACVKLHKSIPGNATALAKEMLQSYNVAKFLESVFKAKKRKKR